MFINPISILIHPITVFIDKVTIFDSGNGESGVGNVGSYVPNVLAKTMETVKEVTGLDIVDIMKAQTYDAKVTRNINISGLPEESGDAAKAVATQAAVKAATEPEGTTEE